VTERFAWKKKYFYDEENLELFREEYDQMPVHRQAMENPYLVAAVLATVLLLGVGVLASIGIV
jgi:restriction endonuclease Mrr